MTRTPRRRAAKAAPHVHNEEAPVRTAVDASCLLSEDEWLSVSETLDGLLRLEFRSPFTDLELLCPKEAWLVVDLSRVRASASVVPSFRHQIVRVLDCLARLLVHAEALRPSRDLFEAFWRRVVTSEMLRGVEDDEAKISGFARYVRAKGSHVALQWRGRTPNEVIKPLRKWLETDVDTLDHPYTPVQIGLRFEDCQLTSKNLKDIQKLLQAPVTSSKKRLLCEANNLRELSLSSNILPVHMLRELATMLEDPCTRRIDGLKLDSTAPDQAHQPPSYGSALSQVIAAVVSKKPTDSDGHIEDPGVSLSLEDCAIYHAAHITTLAATLASATRPLRGLSLACWQFPDLELCIPFGRLLMTHFPTATDAFDLNVSCIRSPPGAYDVEWKLIEARTEVMDEVTAAGKAVSIRPLATAEFYPDDPDIEPVQLSTSTYYNVRRILDCRCCSWTSVPVNGVERMGNVERLHVANARIEGVSGPSGLIVDRCTRGHEGGTLVKYNAAVFCDRLKRLSMRGTMWNSEQFFSLGSILEQLNVEGCSYDSGPGNAERRRQAGRQQMIQDLSDVAAASLQALNVRASSLDASNFETILAFPRLRRLTFAHNQVVDPPNNPVPDTLLRAFRCGGMLEYVDIREGGFDPENKSHAVVQVQVTDLLEHERLSYDARRAFLGALRHIPVKLSSDVVATILAFANPGEPRKVLW